jgi:hypothetical protein
MYVINMIDNNDSLARLAHATGMTDVEHEERQALMAEVNADHDEPEPIWEDHYEDIDYGYHDQYDQ